MVSFVSRVDPPSFDLFDNIVFHLWLPFVELSYKQTSSEACSHETRRSPLLALGKLLYTLNCFYFLCLLKLYIPHLFKELRSILPNLEF